MIVGGGAILALIVGFLAWRSYTPARVAIPPATQTPRQLNTDEHAHVMLTGTLVQNDDKPIAYSLVGNGWTIYADLSSIPATFAAQLVGKTVVADGDQVRAVVVNRRDPGKSQAEDFLVVGTIEPIQ